ncbi:HAMP domain-containing histidine kinase [Macrococcus hajekii]|uniref:Signal transduction histidine-protein kinase ArlS n=1 Tax=Macrococcus hajekii TaxID=198482 RepID=A0A4R6BMX6_9STAP|nr:HAMP domain-containing histidine kinase [Macrococcus hajekii]TDM03042.1 HAMP domain-containing histidine kinase [Macrococcus hajekii]GGB06100.1 signal transduction histidine-protein kinase ArlS [Macrococcus hajekii]
MKKSTSLKTQWMLTTTSVTFVIFMLFSLIIIMIIALLFKDQETQNVTRSTIEVGKYLEKEGAPISRYDIIETLSPGQRAVIYTADGRLLASVSFDDTVPFTPSNDLVRNQLIQVEDKDKSYLIYTTPVNSERFTGHVSVVHSLDSYQANLQVVILFASIFGVIALFITAVVSYFFSNQITKPIRRISDQMKQIQRDGFQNRLVMPRGYYETDDMIETFNEMMLQLENSFNQQKQFVEDASHELRTPLQIIKGHLNLIKRWGKNKPEVLEESLEISLSEMNRITSLVEELLLLTKEVGAHTHLEPEQVDINDEISSRLRSLANLHPDYQFEYHSPHKVINLTINRFHFEQLMLIFLDNAIKYDQGRKHIIIRSSKKNKLIQIEIIDHGTGIPEEDLPFVFDRFYRVDKSRSREMGGNGLGLSIAKKIVESYQGTVHIESERQRFTKVIIQFPDKG